MSKQVKNLMSDHLRNELEQVEDALLVNVVGLTANATVALRSHLRSKDIQLRVVKNSLARRALEGKVLAEAFVDAEGPLAIVWGAEDVVSLAKEVVTLAGQDEYESFEARGGTMDGALLTSDQVVEVSKWPSRGEQLSLLVGQILAPGAKLAGQLLGPGGLLASQVKQKADGDDEA